MGRTDPARLGLAALGRPLLVLLAGILLMHLGLYMVVPVLPVILKVGRGLDPAQVGLVLGTGSVAFQVGSLLGGTLSDWIGRRQTMVVGALVRAEALAAFGLIHGLWPLVTVSIANGIGGGFYAPTAKAAIAALASVENRTTAFSLRGIAANIGTSLAGVAALLLATGAARGLFFVAGAIHVMLALLTWMLVPRDCGERACPAPPPGLLKRVLADRPFLAFSAMAVAIWTLYAQLALAVPLRAAGMGVNPRSIGLIWTVNSLIVISLQAPVTRFIIRRLHPVTAAALGVAFLGAGLGSVAWSARFLHLFLSAAVFIVGEMLIMPTMDSIVSQLSRAEAVGAYFGIANFSSGLGEGLGNLLGGQLLTLAGRRAIPALPWFTYAAAGAAIALAMTALRYWQPLRQALVPRA